MVTVSLESPNLFCLCVCVYISLCVRVGKFIQSLNYMYSRGFRQRSRLYEFVHPCRAMCMCGETSAVDSLLYWELFFEWHSYKTLSMVEMVVEEADDL